MPFKEKKLVITSSQVTFTKIFTDRSSLLYFLLQIKKRQDSKYQTESHGTQVSQIFEKKIYIIVK